MLRIRQIKTTTKDGRIVPVLDEHGREIETAVVEIPREIEAGGATEIEAYVAATPKQRETLLKRATTPPADVPAPVTTTTAEEAAR